MPWLACVNMHMNVVDNQINWKTMHTLIGKVFNVQVMTACGRQTPSFVLSSSEPGVHVFLSKTSCWLGLRQLTAER